jgi:hypothetical protein
LVILYPDAQGGIAVYIGRSKAPRFIWRWIDRTFKAAAFALAPLIKVDTATVWQQVAPFISHVQHGLYIPIVLVISPITGFLRRKSDNARLDDVHSLLDQLRDAAFKNETPELEQHRRVTLFQHKPFAWHAPFFGGFLVPVERSGSQTRRTKAFFRAPDDGERCEGVAGRTWAKNKTVYVGELPNLHKDVADASVHDYAHLSFISEKRTRCYLDDNKTAPRALLGLPVEVTNKKWGVLVFDSTATTINARAANQIFKKLNPTLSGYLKGL